MENTLEVRWFVKGLPPAVVQRWFRLECLGKPQQPEVRKDWYAYQKRNDLNKPNRFFKRTLHPEEINLKLRQNRLELKLRQQEFGIYA